MKSHAWLKYSLNENIVVIEIRSPSGGKLDTYKWRAGDKYAEKKILSSLKHKYGYDFSNGTKDTDKDIEWLKKDAGY